MLNIEINNKEYNIPNKWEEMTLDYYCGIYEIIKKYQITEEEENSENDLTKYLANQENKMYRDLFIYMTKIDEKTMKNVPISDVFAVIECLEEIMEEYKPKGLDYFEFEGDVYYFPLDFLRTGTFGDYIESQQLEMNTQYLKNGRFDILPEQMAILCKKVDEEVDLDDIDEKAKKFRGLTMDIVWEFSFFLNKRTLASLNVIKTFSEMVEQKVSQ
ncbi:hypothetical protein [Marinobacter sp.]|uniref:hypothetical protein n=1 Tax=Marinobacter sp. TaxID=50741 RepID=UPI000C8E42BC|nr:hypothetical protein [Marinobacter sp.]MAB51176.1 hypothetical protein [Marinobacter sp.]|tara:strand:- start:2473 stop:3117 length:645 start_codon:yes stop_codon:yes gene_type:complete